MFVFPLCLVCAAAAVAAETIGVDESVESLDATDEGGQEACCGLASLFVMKMKQQAVVSHRISVLEHLREGFAYAFGFAPIRYILFLLGLVSLMGVPYQVLMPIFAKDIFFFCSSLIVRPFSFDE
jgi:hypothetical protein